MVVRINLAHGGDVKLRAAENRTGHTLRRYLDLCHNLNRGIDPPDFSCAVVGDLEVALRQVSHAHSDILIVLSAVWGISGSLVSQSTNKSLD